MATIDELEQQKLAGGAGGSVLAGNGGAAQPVGQSNTGSGFTNLQKYLSANQGQGGQLADSMIGQGQGIVDAGNKVANENADTWAAGQIKDIQGNASEVAGGYDTAAADIRAQPLNLDLASSTPDLKFDTTGAADRKGYNDLDAAYQKAITDGNTYATDFNTQNAGMQKQFGYGSGFGALDTFLGRQDGKEKIQGWQGGLKAGNAGAQAAQVNAAITTGQGQIDTAKAGFGQANTEARNTRTKIDAPAPVMNTTPKTSANGVAKPNTPVGGIAGDYNGDYTDYAYDPEKQRKGGVYR
jgi:hypothetical protein